MQKESSASLNSSSSEEKTQVGAIAVQQVRDNNINDKDDDGKGKNTAQPREKQ